ncbi:glutaredoxin family protein [Guptibacillus hwajinpoensis]|uniref:glutaredoxin family protein n=1 Tax=Guptibacillus hwajinpoensis TaxID=208199 RepID=UPI0018835668|nr:glutaredoxin family protein [Pseudalkalibacillus hwajinpoensis]MBF0705694.1 glutaredoxin family protein [Pseudalkalibacillus hwajinpoensis]WLR61247.1 glutaredoxin family protein [Pseudalkalibacillus hwajinpoensis]
MQKSVILYSKETCPLCDEAYELLLELQKEEMFSLQIVDIYKDEALLEKFMLMIPVVEIDEEVVDYGRISKKSIRKRLL